MKFRDECGRCDKNGDGRLTEDEVKEVRQKETYESLA